MGRNGAFCKPSPQVSLVQRPRVALWPEFLQTLLLAGGEGAAHHRQLQEYLAALALELRPWASALRSAVFMKSPQPVPCEILGDVPCREAPTQSAV